jgi:GNAT superfamily N-acetyltransferase
MTVGARPVDDADREWIEALLREHWGGEGQAAHGELFFPADHEGFMAFDDAGPIGVITYRVEAGACEVTFLHSLKPGHGAGSVLLHLVAQAAREAGCRRLWLITTNDNRHAQTWYVRRGLRLAAVHEGAVDSSRKMKPSIPLVGDDGTPIRDEIEMELVL